MSGSHFMPAHHESTEVHSSLRDEGLFARCGFSPSRVERGENYQSMGAHTVAKPHFVPPKRWTRSRSGTPRPLVTAATRRRRWLSERRGIRARGDRADGCAGRGFRRSNPARGAASSYCPGPASRRRGARRSSPRRSPAGMPDPYPARASRVAPAARVCRSAAAESAALGRPCGRGAPGWARRCTAGCP